ncbi:hypothetical protein FQN54_009816 [Arachnomyces sp. PD_36]|nr:hypothetical protein FQN54_009816 [Arachnomyces sp. PD_36]
MAASEPDTYREVRTSIPTSGVGPRADTPGSGYHSNTIHDDSEPLSSTSSTSNGSSRRTPLADNAASLEWVNSTIQSLAAGKNAADRKRVRSHVMAQRNRKKRQEEVERYQKLKTKSTVLLRPAPVPSSTPSAVAAVTAATTVQTPVSIPSSIPDERARSRSIRAEPIKLGTPVPPVLRKQRSSQSRKRNAESRKATAVNGTGRAARDIEVPAIKKEEPGYVYDFNAEETRTNEEDAQDLILVKKEESFTPSPLTTVPPWTYIGQGSSDPFSAMATKVTGRMREYIHYYVNIIVPVAYPLCRSSRFLDRYNFGAFAQENAGLLHGLISGAATYQGMAKGIPPPYGAEHLPIESLHPITVDSLYHKGEAIRLVNEKLSNPIEATTDATVVAITVLCIGEIFKGHYEQILMHLEGLRRVVTLRGSLGDFPWPVVCQIKIADIKIATITLRKPIFPFPRRFLSSPTSTTIDPGPNLAKQGTLLFSPKNLHIFHDDMLSVFHDLIKMVWYAEFIRNTPHTSSRSSPTALSDVEEDYFIHQILYIEHRLLQFPFDRESNVSSGGGRPENKVEAACRYVCLIFTLIVLWGHYSNMSPVTRSPLIALRYSLGDEPDLENGSWADCHDVYLWITFMGAHSSRDQPERRYFVEQFVRAAGYLGVESLEGARELLLGFFYTDYAFLESLREVWGEGFGCL